MVLANRASIPLVVLLLLASALYLQRSSVYLMSDDEGSYGYAAWRVSLGEMPYRDFSTPQMPGFLYWGGLVACIFGRSITALRLATLLATLVAACFLYVTNRQLFDAPIALGSTALFLVDANVFHNARFFRPEAYLLLFAMAGVYAFVLGEKRSRLAYTGLAGVFFGLSILCKLFGLLPLGGCCLYLLYVGWRERQPCRRILLQGLALSMPALLITSVVTIALSRAAPYFLTAVFRHHTMQGAQLTMAQRVVKALLFYREYVAAQPLSIALAVPGAFWLLRRARTLSTIFVWQVPTALVFLVLSRELFARHLTYLTPAIATLLAVTLSVLWRRRGYLRGAAFVLAAAVAFPLLRAELFPAAPEGHDTAPLAALIQDLSAGDEGVISDYTGLNFAAARRSTYWAAGLSGGAAESGQIRGSALVDEMRGGNVSMVLINTLGRGRQMVDMAEYDEFRRYVQAHLALVAKVPMGYRQFEVYARRDAMPLKPGSVYHDELILTGIRFSEEAVSPGTALGVDTRWQTRQTPARDYRISLRLVDATGRVWAQRDERLQEESSRSDARRWEIREQFPTSRWAAQQVVLQKHQVPVDAAVPAGSYYLAVRLYDPGSGAVAPVRQGEGTRLPGGDVGIATVRVLPSEAPLNPDALPIAVRLQASLAADLEVVGSGPMPTTARAGRNLALELFWRAPVQPAQDYRLQFSLLQGENVRQRWTAEVAEGFPTSGWRPGQVVLGSYCLPLDGSLQQSDYELQVAVADVVGHPLGRAQLLSAGLAITPQPDPGVIEEAITHPLAGLSFAGRISLLGYDLAPEELGHGESLHLTLYWRCLQSLDADYTVFAHLVDGAGQIQGQRDGVPENGEAPTSGWRQGDIIVDPCEIELAATAPAGTLQLAIGLYEPFTGERLPLLRDGQPAGEDRLILPTAISMP